MEKVIELRAKASYFDKTINCPVDYGRLINEMYSLILKENISEERAKELIDLGLAYLVSIKRKVKE